MGDWFLHALRVRYQETDRMKVVYHTNYVTWFEIGRTEWIRQAGIAYRDIEEKGLLLPVVRLEANFHQPASYDDWVTVCTRVTEMTKVRLRFEYRIMLGDLTQNGQIRHADPAPEGKLLASGGTLHGWVNGDWKPARLDREAPEVYATLVELAKKTGANGETDSASST